MKDTESGSIDVAFDKGTLDATVFGSPWSPPERQWRTAESTWERSAY
jgi:O-glycosyl hydrolase